MAGKWVTVALGEICEFRSGTAFPTRYQGAKAGEHPFIKVSDMNLPMNSRWIVQANHWVSEEVRRKLKARIHPPGATVFAKIGVALTYNRRRLLALPSIIDNNMMSAIPRSSTVDAKFLYYLLCTLDFNEIVSGTALPYLSADDLANIEVTIPESLSEQRAIAYILGTLDDKIELLRRMNETLEGMARALFKSWFVDFDPVIDNALEAGNPIPDELKEKAKRRLALGDKRKPLPEHIRRLFPDRFVDSELGPIPEGWRVGTMAELVSLRRELVNPRDFPDEIFVHYSIPAFDNGRTPISEPGRAIKSNKLLVPRNAVLLSKLNPRFPRVWMPIVSGSRRSICSTEFLVTIPNDGSSREFIFCLFTEAGFRAKFSTLVTGTSGSHQRVNPRSFLTMQVVIPPNGVVELFTRFIQSPFELISENLVQSRTLAALRDTLLPKLISGEIRVRDEKKILEGLE